MKTDTLQAIAADTYAFDRQAEGGVGQVERRGFVIVPQGASTEEILLSGGSLGDGSPILAEVYLESDDTTHTLLAERAKFESMGIDVEEFAGLLDRVTRRLVDPDVV